ncbi:MAG TPA: SRPBCC family protein [Candidatus Acidoferrales bacterium]|nr:SRPBCC family protein [Candidatus Acidoferrales bacterium]
MTTSTDRIEKRVFLRAPQEKVWRAISDAREFGDWFGIEFEGEFVCGARAIGRIKPTRADAEVAQRQAKYAGKRIEFVIERIEPMTIFSYRWHPFAIDPGVDYSQEPMTLVTFTLEPQEGGTLLRVVESGFDSVPLARRADAFEANEEGWAVQMHVVEKYLLLTRP